ncbi:MAG: trypsin-like peptidase domain-containing protein [Planctomycetes bacterium]|nr:trypsin-like peptidase domain-containing protein [Planctomycetota bacterium]
MKTNMWKAGRVVVLVAAMVLMVGPAAVMADDAQAYQELQERIEKVSENLGKSVVSVQTKAKVTEQSLGGDSDLWDMLPDQWRRRLPQRRQEPKQDSEELVPQGIGSGVIISTDGYILTNQHVVRGADEVDVVMADKRHFKATVVGQDARSDLAVLKIDAEDLPAAELNGSAEVRRGMFVLAVGSPFGFGADGQASVSFGIVSGTRRRLALGTEEEDRFYGKLIQTDAAINPGNSGGPLCALDGKVIGVNVAIASRGGGSQGVGFAIPIDEATLDIIQRLKKGKEIEYGYLGVEIRDPRPIESETAGAKIGMGAFVSSVVPGSPADKAGLMPADLIVELNGKPVTDADDLVARVGMTPVGEKVEMVLYRSGEKITATAKVVRRDADKIASGNTDDGDKDRPAPEGSFEWRGLTLQDLTPALRKEAEVDENVQGVYVARVDDDSKAHESGLRAGMVIDQVASQKVGDLETLKKASKKLKGPVFVNVVGRGPMIVGQ